ncbi:hypothetical protein [Pseudofulvibacter geojedonensis]|uniref:Uncharacterized protein n=1 Tax=Pseudofulvibacter geojedonensis TaxID=1123758 RepID=A0ABW3I0D4_9FLAO
MKIINAITHFPKERAKVNTNQELPLDDNRPRFSSEDLVLDATLPVCKQLLEEVNFNPLEIDLILNITLTPDRLFQDKTIGVPRVAHPIHYLIKAENAFVIDIHESDWNTAFTIAKAFMVDQNRKNVLIIRTEFLHSSVHPDYKSGFNIPDGIALILAEQDNDEIAIDYKDLETKDVFCRYDMLPKGGELAEEQFRSKLTWKADEKYVEDLNKTGQEFLNQMLEKNKEVDGVVFESWFPKHDITCEDSEKVFKSIQKEDTFKSLGAFSLPHYLRELKENKEVSTICSISYSPFINRYSGTVLSV